MSDSKVQWLREKQFGNGVSCKISDKTGIIALQVEGAGRRNAMLYRDEIQMILDVATHLETYLSENEDVAPSKGESTVMRQKVRKQQQLQVKAAETLAAIGLTPEQITAALSQKPA